MPCKIMDAIAIILLIASALCASVSNLSIIDDAVLHEEPIDDQNIDLRNRRSNYPETAGANVDMPISGAAFGGSLYLCSFISYNGDSCKYVTSPESYYVLVQNDFVRITGQLSAPHNGQRILSTVNMEFYDEQGRTSAVYSRSLNSMFANTCESGPPVHYRFIDDNTKDIRLIECSSSNAVYLLNDRRQIFIAILPTPQGLWLSVNMHRGVVDKSKGILIDGLSQSMFDDMLPFDGDANAETEINECYIEADKAIAGVTPPSAHMGGVDASLQLRKICVDALRRGSKNAALMQQQYNQINQRTNVLFQHHSSSQLPLYLTKLEASFEPALFQSVSTLPTSYNPSESNAQFSSPMYRGNNEKCTCLESLPSLNWPRSDGQAFVNSTNRNQSSLDIYPHSMMAVQESENHNILMRGMMTPSRLGQTNSTNPVRIESKDNNLFQQGEGYPNFIVKYDSQGARLARMRRSVMEDIKSNETSGFVQLQEFSLLRWMGDKRMMCAVANEIQPNFLIVSLKPKRYLNCSDSSNNGTVMPCADYPRACEGSYNLIINF